MLYIIIIIFKIVLFKVYKLIIFFFNTNKMSCNINNSKDNYEVNNVDKNDLNPVNHEFNEYHQKENEIEKVEEKY